MLGRSAAVAMFAVCACGHANHPCPAPRELAPRRPALAPADPAIAAAVKAAGARYEVCPDRQHYLVVRDGKRELKDAERLEIRTGFFGAVEGVVSAGIGGCRCGMTDPPWPGIQVDVREKGATPEEIARRLVSGAAQAGAADATVRVQVTILTAPGLRCAPGDPACGPEPYDHQCLEKTDYNGKKKRKLVYQENGRERTVAGQCTHDGECFQDGCGNQCSPTSHIPAAGTCEGRFELEHAYCGCVNTACAWFTTE
jgi:hypothetical protein